MTRQRTPHAGTDDTAEDDTATISFSGSFVPTEIIIAAGFTPRPLIPSHGPAGADAYLHSNTCGYLKCALTAALAGDFADTNAVILTNSCDGQRRLYDAWSEYVETPPALFLDIPTKKDPASVDYFASELRRLAGRLQATLDCPPLADEALEDAIRAGNSVRRQMGQVFALQRKADPRARGVQVFEACMEGMGGDPRTVVPGLDILADERPGADEAGDPRRIVLTANVLHRPDLIALIEKTGGRVVGLDTEFANRHYDREVEEGSSDPYRALARRYLWKAPCARMQGIEERGRYLEELVDDAQADGVVYALAKFCDVYTDEIPLIKDGFDRAGIPLLVLENDYEWENLEQTRTRVETFLEILPKRKETCDVQDDA